MAGPETSGPNASNSADADVVGDPNLLKYLSDNQGETEFLVAVETSSQSVPIILATGEPVLTIGGYKSRDPYPTADELADMVQEGALHYALLGDRSPGGVGSSAATRATLQAVTDWITTHGTIVDPSKYDGSASGTLYYLGDELD